MAIANQGSGYLSPQSTRVFYDAANDIVRITCADEAFGSTGLSAVLKKGSKSDLVARAALVQSGINADPEDLSFLTLPSVAERVLLWPSRYSLNWQVGTGSEGPVTFDFQDGYNPPHLLIGGNAGTGKTPLLASMIEQLIERECRLWVIDPPT